MTPHTPQPEEEYPLKDFFEIYSKQEFGDWERFKRVRTNEARDYLESLIQKTHQEAFNQGVQASIDALDKEEIDKNFTGHYKNGFYFALESTRSSLTALLKK